VGHRLLKVNESVREVVSAVIAEGLKDPRVGFVTVTGVETSPDLRHAKVFVSVLGGERERTATLDGLKASHGYLQARVNEALHMKRTPQLTFVYDETTDKAMRIERLLRREAEELGETPPDAAVPEEPEPLLDGAVDGGSGEDGAA
jgi:ribosome-binding factor A